MKRLSILAAAAMTALVGLAAPVQAQDYPKQDIHVIVGFPAGSGADVYARFFANKLQALAKVTVVVENKPGANSMIATETVAKAKPDGYTIFIGGSDSFGAPLYIFKKPAIDPNKDFVYISPLVSQAFILMVEESKPYKTVADLTAAMKQKGTNSFYASTNNPAIILAESYKKIAGLETVQVPYKTSVEFVNDMMSGRIDWVMADPVFAIARMNEKKMRPLGISTAKRISAIPDIPTLQEAGVPTIDMNLWWVTAAPAGTPAPIVAKLNEWFTAIGKDPETKTFLGRFGAEPWVASLAETTALIDKEIKDWEGYVKIANIQAQ